MSRLNQLAELLLDTGVSAAKAPKLPDPVQMVKNKSLSYTQRHRGQWFRPEYNLVDIQIAQDRDGYLFRSIQKKVNRFMIAGYELHGNNPDAVSYLKKRIAEIERVTNQPFKQLMRETVQDLFRFGNCMWVKVRAQESSSGRPIRIYRNAPLDPVAGYFTVAFETLEFQTAANGTLRSVRQMMPDGSNKEFKANEVVHFHVNKKPGFAIGTPEVFPVMDDLELLRRMEENVEELVETNLFPVFHYRIGTDKMPEKVSPGGITESDIAKKQIEYMPPGSIYVSDHRHEIKVLGSESHALRIDFYLTYFKNRVLSGLGISAVDVGEGDTANKGTASTMSKSLIQDVEAMQEILKTFIEFHVFAELLEEGGWDPMNADEQVEICFGVIDKEEWARQENQTIQALTNKLITVTEARRRIGKPAYTEDGLSDTYFTLFEEPLVLAKGMAAGTANAEILAELPYSNVTPEATAHAEQYAATQSKMKQSTPTTANTSNSRARPTNQYGTRTAPSYSGDAVVLRNSTLQATYLDELRILDLLVASRAKSMGLSEDTVYQNLQYRAKAITQRYLVMDKSNV